MKAGMKRSVMTAQFSRYSDVPHFQISARTGGKPPKSGIRKYAGKCERLTGTLAGCRSCASYAGLRSYSLRSATVARLAPAYLFTLWRN